jgi:RimJ/RimL family protein N-acetyltransferase
VSRPCRVGDGGELVGVVGIHPEPEHERARMGYWIGRPHWSRGFATEAASEAVDWAFRELVFGLLRGEHGSEGRGA